MTENVRKEWKYIINIEKYRQIQKKMECLMIPDSHGTHGSYVVRSQYFDSLTDADLYDNLAGVEEKRKIRVRVYSPKAVEGKLEYKCKNGNDGKKEMIPLSKEEMLLLEQHQYGFLLERKEPLAWRLYAKMTEQIYRPKTIIEYDRTSYLYPISHVRITFDRNLRASRNPYGICEEKPFFVPLMSLDKGVLEVKYNEFFPYALKPILQELGNTAEAYSKYTAARLFFS